MVAVYQTLCVVCLLPNGLGVLVKTLGFEEM